MILSLESSQDKGKNAHHLERQIERFNGLGEREPFVAVILTFFLFSLTGLPVFAGFIGKFYLFASVVNGGLYWLAIIGVLNSVVSLYFYARLVKAMFLVKDESAQPVQIAPLSFLQKAVLLILAVPTLVFGIYWEPIMTYARMSVFALMGN